MQTTLNVALRAIVADSALQPRVEGLDAEHIHELEDAAETWPPLKVVKRDERYVLVDGFHRFAAAQNLGLETISAEVLDPPLDGDLAGLAFALNAAHGKPLTLSDRRAFAARLLREHPDFSDREIGRRVGLVQPTIAKVRQELEKQAAIAPTETRKGRDGRNYPASLGPSRKVTLADALGSVAAAFERAVLPAERVAQRELARYLIRVADVIEDQDRLTNFPTFSAAATACCSALGDEKAKELGSRLGWSTRNVLLVARALGYRDDEQVAP